MIRFASAFAFTLVISGCASVLPDNDVPAPAWFEAKREEAIAQGYPDIRTAIPAAAEDDSRMWNKIARQIEVARRQLERADPGPVETDEAAMRAWVAERQAIVAKGEEPY